MFTPPPPTCTLCPRLAAYRLDNQKQYPDFFNAPVPSFGELSAKLLVVGLAPGLKGANRTGRPFTGDYAGELLYPTLIKFGWAEGIYKAEVGDITLKDCRITNAVRCVPPQNRPESGEEKNCLPFLVQEIANMPNLQVILALGRVAHLSTLKALKIRAAAYPFAHGAVYGIDNKWLVNSYHCSRYNTSTKRLTTAMFAAVFEKIRGLIG